MPFLPNAVKDVFYGVPFYIMGDVNSVKLTKGLLPAGLNFYGYDISGTPTKTGTYTFTLTAEGDYGSTSQEYTIKVTDPIPPTITTEEITDAAESVYFSQYLRASGSQEIRWSVVNGDLPDGLNLSEYSGELWGTPTKSGWFFSSK